MTFNYKKRDKNLEPNMIPKIYHTQKNHKLQEAKFNVTVNWIAVIVKMLVTYQVIVVEIFIINNSKIHFYYF